MNTVNIEPFSINKAWQGKRFKTKEYGYWREACMYALRGIEPVHGKVEVWTRFHIQHITTTDTNNLIKTLFDAMVDAKIIDDDRFIYREHHEKVPLVKGEGEKIEIEIQPYST